ncbi:hypothetical protein LTR09_009035 [Extremus antarcticus]|uniref:Uncharacterized protein n=1 Tax=Extremus antarcticus TaxID=702011 RepID=A0AAJ0DG70_9PEZI|nr:hypothetical protein LTR09_009035 [Extremus antarcticus]
MEHQTSAVPALSNSSPQTQSPFFALPAELRNDIYHRALTARFNWNDRGTIKLSSRKNKKFGPNLLMLLQTCRLICCEAREIFYSIHHLELDCDGIVTSYQSSGATGYGSFVRELDPGRLNGIQVLTTNIDATEQARSVLVAARRCERLHYLRLYFLLDHRHMPSNHHPEGFGVEFARERETLKNAIDACPQPLRTIHFDFRHHESQYLGNFATQFRQMHYEDHCQKQYWELGLEITETLKTFLESSIARRQSLHGAHSVSTST